MGNCEVYTVLFIGLLAVVLAIAAEWTKVKSNEVIVTNLVNRYGRRYCEYPRRRDWQFAAAAAAAAALAFFNMKFIFFINYYAVLDYMDRTAKLPATAVIYFVFSGLAAYSGFSTLVAGAVFSRNQTNADSPSNCRVFNNGYYISGVVLLLKACGFGILSYCYLSENLSSKPLSRLWKWVRQRWINRT